MKFEEFKKYMDDKFDELIIKLCPEQKKEDKNNNKK